MRKKGLYKGFSSFEFQRRKTFKLRDLELVKMDLLNHIFTSKGERIMMPNFGTSIPEMTFEPLDSETVSLIKEELVRVINYDPRVDLVNIDTVPNYDTSSISVSIQLFYLELDLYDNMELNIEFTG